MIRRPRGSQYNIKAYLVKPNQEHVFWCKEQRLKAIVSDIGELMAGDKKVIETDSPLDFKLNDIVTIGNDRFTVENVNSNVNTKNQNARRGNPTYIQTIQLT